MDLWTGSDVEFSKVLSEKYGGKPSGWRSQIKRFKREGGTNANIDIDESGFDVEEAYFYNNDTDVYVTFLRAAGGKPIKVSGDTHRAMKEAYSNMVGKPATINEISRTFQFPRNWFDEYRRIHGWTHDMDPFTNEEVEDSEVEDLVDDLVLRNRRALHQAHEKRKWADIQKDAEKWRTFEETVLERFDTLKVEVSKPVPRVEMKDSGEAPYALVVSPTDFHWGKFGWVDETGETYNFDEAKSRLMSKTEELISRLPYRPEKIILATGSDWFHIDNDAGNTTRGTPMGTSMCGSPAQILISGCQLARLHVDVLRQVAPVDVVFMAGNHDRFSAVTLGLYLSAVYENSDDCEVFLTPHVRHYSVYGNTLLGFTHGDTVKPHNLPTVMSQEQWEEWGRRRFKVWFMGHYHHQETKEDGGCIRVTLPSLAANDRWHSRMGYKSQAGLSGHLIDRERGLVGTLFCPVL